VDKDSVIGSGAKIGAGIDFRPNDRHPEVMAKGVTLIGKASRIPPRSVIGRNCLVRACPDSGTPVNIASGTTLVEPPA
jgi:glucose-1-phosphate adenylyltransferase